MKTESHLKQPPVESNLGNSSSLGFSMASKQ